MDDNRTNTEKGADIRADCPCKRTKCSRHGRCDQCLRHHDNKRYPAACKRSEKPPKKGKQL